MTLASTVDDLAEAFGRRRSTRRKVLQRAAMAGAALTVAPSAFMFRPGSAYGAICGCSGQSCDCGSTCCDGYTEFCCTISGVNRCPPGTLLGGWWKVDGSSFCGGGPRYYLDCNAQCGSCSCGASGVCAGTCSGTPCGCANGSCGNRKAGCTRFRYGQCHQEVACLGPIVCRVVTCTSPWQLDGSCGTSSRVDEATRNHNRPCLQGAPLGSLELIQSVPGGVRFVGWAADPDISGPTEVHAYIGGGGGYNLGPANRPRPDVGAAFPALGPNHGFDTVVPDLRDGTFDVCVYAINTAGPSGHTTLGCRSVKLSRGPYGNLDVVARTPTGIRVSGWAIDPDSSVSVPVRVSAGASSVDLGLADEDRPDVAAAYPGYGAAHGFSGEIPYSGPSPVTVCATGSNTSGAGGTTTIGCRSYAIPRNPSGNLESVTRVPGGLRVQGWALDPDTSGSIEVHVYARGGGTNLGPAAIARPDVEAAYPGYGSAHGFDAVIPIAGDGPVEICAYGINVASGANVAIGCRTVVFSSNPFGSLEVLRRSGTSIRVAGWVLDPSTASSIEAHVYINGGGTNLGPADDPRPDVAAVYPGYGANHGLDATIDGLPASGRLDVSVYAINSGPGSNVLLGTWTLP